MRKFLLFIFALFIGIASYSQAISVAKHLLNTAVEVEYQKPTDVLPIGATAELPSARSINLAINETIIGQTFYDVQSNSLVSNRIVMHPDGTMGATWTRGMEPTSYPERGTGYNFYDGSAWGPAPTVRLESVRCGWPSYTTWGLTGEMNVSHNASTGLFINKRENRGTGAWTEVFVPGPTGIPDVTWPRMITSGEDHDVIHMLCANDAGFGGQSSAMFYSKSTDGGVTWDPNYEVMDGTGIDYYNEINADQYVMASRGNTVAILVAGAWHDMFLLKSTDNGENWNKTVIWEHPYPFFDWESTIADTFFSVDNSASCAIGPDGKVHVVFGMTRVMHLELGTTYNYFPYVDGIGYWNEDMPPFSNDLSALAGPQYGYPTSEMVENYNYIGWSQDVDGDGEITYVDNLMSYNQLGLTTQPSIIVDDEGKVFVVWASTTETYDNIEYNFKKIWGRAFDNGSWGPFIHITSDIVHIFDESIYPMLASGNDDELHVMYQADGSPGLAATTTPDHDAHENNIIVAAIDKTDLLTGIGDGEQLINAESVSQNYPNPFRGTTTITVNLEESANLSLTVTNILGQEVLTMERGSVAAGTYFFEVDGTDMQEGIYFYTVKADNSSVTKKMVVR